MVAKIIKTSPSVGNMVESQVSVEDLGGREGNLVCVMEDCELQRVRGFGGAFTESSGVNYNKLSPDDKEKFIRAYFSSDGIGYSIGRITLGSCDFGIDDFVNISDGDAEFSTFNIEREKKNILPMIKAALVENKDIFMYISPWSAPAFMKDNKIRNRGGKLLSEYRDAWSEYFVKFIENFRKKVLRYLRLQLKTSPMQDRRGNL